MKYTTLLLPLLTLAAAVLDTQEAKDELYARIDLAGKQLYDKAGKLKTNFLEGWSQTEVAEWAEAHSLEVPKPGEVQAFALRYRDLIEADVNNFVAVSKSRASPILNNIPQHIIDGKNAAVSSASSVIDQSVSSASSVIDQSFDKSKELYDNAVNAWSDFRLREYLEARGVHVPTDADRQRVVDLVTENWRKPLTKLGDWSFDGWSVDEIKAWLESQGRKAEGGRKQLLGQAEAYFGEVQAQGTKSYASVKASLDKTYYNIKKSSFDSWNDSDLKQYIESFGAKAASTHDELVKQARQKYELSVATLNGLGNSAGSLFSTIQAYLDEGLAQIELWYHHIKRLVKTEL